MPEDVSNDVAEPVWAVQSVAAHSAVIATSNCQIPLERIMSLSL
jgi:hypothetical protein